ncbi:MAG: bifunctional folylpolyglutamate synthase/dihydrofolate synthase [Bacteroidota bacterium]|nr:bifunctional folylpolyglutamate synthase/dihydrofolate synthase [Bacteroidota bacterium]
MIRAMEFDKKAYEALVASVFLRFPSVQKAGFDGAYKPGLAHMLAFDEALGYPSRAFRSIHVAGTNGKGSVCNMLASVLSAAGIRTGLYTSPHIVDFRERIRINGELIPKEYAYEFLTEWEGYFVRNELSFFEITTGLCFKYFADSGVEVAVIETGLGGLLDSTNILRPELTVVTNIGMDHMAYLGNTLAEIGAQKAGIFKEGVPALVGECGKETDPVFAEKAWMHCPLTFAEKVSPTLWNRRKEILGKMDLQGAAQEKNLRTVLTALDILRDTQGFRPDEATVVDAIEHTAARTGFHGRWEKLSSMPYVIADIGHNAHALRYSFAQLRRDVSSGRFSSLIIVYGIMADKDLEPVLPLMPEEATYIFCAPDTARALSAEDLLARYRAYCADKGLNPRAYTAASVREAVGMATNLARDFDKPLIYIGGSTFVVSEAVNLFRK